MEKFFRIIRATEELEHLSGNRETCEYDKKTVSYVCLRVCTYERDCENLLLLNVWMKTHTHTYTDAHINTCEHVLTSEDVHGRKKNGECS